MLDWGGVLLFFRDKWSLWLLFVLFDMLLGDFSWLLVNFCWLLVDFSWLLLLLLVWLFHMFVDFCWLFVDFSNWLLNYSWLFMVNLHVLGIVVDWLFNLHFGNWLDVVNFWLDFGGEDSINCLDYLWLFFSWLHVDGLKDFNLRS